MELYVNFNTAGVLLGFIVIGAILGYIDRTAAYHLHDGNWSRFALWALPGISMLQVGGSLVEVTSSAAASVVVALIVGRIRFRRAQPVSSSAYGPAGEARVLGSEGPS